MAGFSFNNPFKAISVSFSNIGLSKTIGDGRGLSDTIPDKDAILNVANVSKDVDVKPKEPLEFDTIPELLGIDYVGYLIEKERYDKNLGWVRTDEYKILGSRANSFKDSRIAYGHQYRYRIRSLVKATTRRRISNFENTENKEDLGFFESKTVEESLEINSDILLDLDTLTNVGLYPQSSTGDNNTFDFELADGIKLIVDENGTQLSSIPTPPPVLGALATGDLSEKDLQQETNETITESEEGGIEYVSSYYAGKPSKRWLYIVAVESDPPPPPSAMKIIPNSVKKHIFITWLKPANSQRDIKSFRVYRRGKRGDQWQLLSEQDDPNNIFTDESVDFNQKYIYALTCVDAHGFESFLSVQIQTELNPDFSFEKREKDSKWISGSGAKLDELDLILKKFLERELPLIVENNISVIPTMSFTDKEKNLIIRITSLDTNEKKELKVNLKNLNIQEGLV